MSDQQRPAPTTPLTPAPTPTPVVQSTTTQTAPTEPPIEQQAENQSSQAQQQDKNLQQLSSLKNRGKSLAPHVNEMINSTSDTQINPFTPGMQAVDTEEEYTKFEGRSPNHSYYIRPVPNATSSNKVYPKPGEGSSGTGDYPPKYIDTIGLRKQREQQAANTEEMED